MQAAMIEIILNLSLFTLMFFILYIFESIVFSILKLAMDFAQHIDDRFNTKKNKVGF